MPAPQSVIDLVHRFESQLASYKSGRYNETELRRDFLDPFFEALGWDVRNTANAAEKYRDVIHESSVEVAGQAKSADYLFKIGATPAFFVEAKKPSVNIETDPAPAFQLKSYAWSKKLPFSILTDFEQLAFYEGYSKPVYDANPAIGRIALFHFKEYLTKWDEIASRISRAAVTTGAFETYVQGIKGKRGTTDVDDAFLAEMERWRDLLAHNIALRNPAITQRELNFTVQTTIDRLIFLRICEDRGIEPEEGLKNATDGIEVYGDLLELFKKADKKYNSGLFHFESEKGRQGYPDTLTPNLKIDDKVFKDILSNLYLPKSPYRFNYFSADILGQVYERFLGKVITMSKTGHRAEIQEKPEVRKAGGVYYTPTYIVDYIVKNTVGELLKDKTPDSFKATPLRVLDPACGSGSFLLGAYQFLMDWYLDWYVQHDPAKHAKGSAPAIIEIPGGWQLTLARKKEILTRHIYGVDIDSQAVEVTKLSLLLKVVENPGQLSLYEERLLPDLAENIKCGNSLIGPDFYENQQGTLFDTEEQYRVNAFDWHKSFPEVFTNEVSGGFDAVIGNPPYGATLDEKNKNYLIHKYPSVSDYETSQYFLIKANSLLNNKGFLGFIVPNTLFLNLFAKKFREHIAKKYAIKKIIDLSNIDVFENATVRTLITILSKTSNKNNIEVFVFNSGHDSVYKDCVNQQELINDDGEWIKILVNHSSSLINKIKDKSISLGSILDISQGLIPYDKYRGHDEKTIKNRIWNSDHKKDETYRRELRGGDVSRFQVIWNGKQWISYGPWLGAPRKPKYFIEPRLLFREITDPKTGLLHVAYCEEEFYNNPGIINCVSMGKNYSLFYLLGISASRLLAYYHFNSSPKANKGVFPKILVNDVRSLPIALIDFSNPSEVAQHDHLVTLVDTMLALHKQLAAARLPDEKERLQRQITSTDHQIDTLVYQLYNLTPEEIAIVEGS